MPFDATPTLTAAEVLATFAAVDAECSFADAALIASIVARSGIDAAVRQTSDDSAILPKLLAYAEALEEIAKGIIYLTPR